MVPPFRATGLFCLILRLLAVVGDDGAKNQRPLVCVTGASGYVASVLVETLKERGYRVRGTVRNVTKYAKEPLFEGVQLYAADLLKDDSFCTAFEGCDAVFHCASPFTTKVKNPQKELIEPAVNGTLNVMRCALKSGVPRMVVTSSTAAIGPPQNDADKLPADKAFTEDDWNRDSTVESGPYRLSKRLAEEAAWEFTEKNPTICLSVINPSFVIGPPVLKRATGVSVGTFVSMLKGELKKKGVRSSCFGAVDVRDVAEAHIRAFESKEAIGKRFLVSSEQSYSQLDFADMLRDRAEFQSFDLPGHLSSPIRYRPKYSHARAEKLLGLKFRKIEESVVDMAKKLISSGMVHCPQLQR